MIIFFHILVKILCSPRRSECSCCGESIDFLLASLYLPTLPLKDKEIMEAHAVVIRGRRVKAPRAVELNLERSLAYAALEGFWLQCEETLMNLRQIFGRRVIFDKDCG